MVQIVSIPPPIDAYLTQNFAMLQQRAQHSGKTLRAIPDRFAHIRNGEAEELLGRIKRESRVALTDTPRNRELALHAACRMGISDEKRPVLIHAPELAETDLSLRLLAIVAGVPVATLQAGCVDQALMAELAMAFGALVVADIHLLGAAHAGRQDIGQFYHAWQAEGGIVEGGALPLMVALGGVQDEWMHEVADRPCVLLLRVG